MIFKNALKSFGTTVPNVAHTQGQILVTGGNGVVAYRVAIKLLAVGYPSVRIGVPNVSKFMELFPDSVTSANQIVEFDWDRSDTFPDALKGVTSVFISLPHHSMWDKNFSTFLTLAQQAGVNHFVKLSFYHAMVREAETLHEYNLNPVHDPFLDIPLVKMHRVCDTKLTRMSAVFNYTLLFASHFMSNATVYQSDLIRKEHRFIGASNGKGVNYVSPNDVAEVAVRALLAPKEHHRVGYTLTGPIALTDQDVADVLSTKIGETITFENQSVKNFMVNATPPDWGPSQDVVYLEMVKSTGIEEKPNFATNDISKICGHPAESFDVYLQEQDLMTPQELQYLRPLSC